ncbi:hypothetical protein BJ878DRAFT_247670 [Calycina marina]|uniref:Uncharacterized protein n=1 Tax=Calycina marina TaxID=1763456 RepID=A0A9P7Z797_9HELO|nr:hypothetical protein BJ878DRAFT_247670 [Calycina marina]
MQAMLRDWPFFKGLPSRRWGWGAMLQLVSSECIGLLGTMRINTDTRESHQEGHSKNDCVNERVIKCRNCDEVRDCPRNRETMADLMNSSDILERSAQSPVITAEFNAKIASRWATRRFVARSQLSRRTLVVSDILVTGFARLKLLATMGFACPKFFETMRSVTN